MLYYLSQHLQLVAEGTAWEETLSGLRVFRYITFRTAGAAVTALLLSWWLGPKMITWLKHLRFGQDYRDAANATGDLKARVLDKRGTPIMGGLLIVMVIDLTVLLWAQWNALTVLTLASLVGFAGLGFYDDYEKITLQDGKGVRGKIKFWVGVLLALFIAGYLWYVPDTRKLITDVIVPFYKHPITACGPWLGVAVTVFTIVGSSNSVNLTDGLDGLAIGCTLIVTAVLLIVTYVAGHARFADYLQVPVVSGAGRAHGDLRGHVWGGVGFSLV